MNQQLIAMIEDEPSHAMLVQYNLENRGYQVRHFTTGQSFLDDFAVVEYSLIIINAEISDISGLELAKKFRERDTDTPCLFLSTSISHTPCVLKDVEFFSKPFKVSALLQRIEQLAALRCPYKLSI